jgi:hypothetical protein
VLWGCTVEFHALELVLHAGYGELGPEPSLVLVDGRTVAGTEAAAGFRTEAERRGVPLAVVDLRRPDLRGHLGSEPT